MEVNPVKAAIEAYSGVNNVFRQDDALTRQKTLDQQALEQRQFENDRQVEADRRAGVLQNMAIETHQKQMKVFTDQQDVANNRAIQYKLMTDPTSISDVDVAHMRQDPKLSKFISNPDEIDNYTTAVGELHKQVPLLLDPQTSQDQRQVAKTQILSNLMKIDPDRFKGMTPTDLIFSPQHQGFSVEVEKEIPVLDDAGKPVIKDGKPVMQKVQRVLTENGNSLEENPNDPVKFYKINEVMGGAFSNAKILNGLKTALKSQQVALGDSEPINQAVKAEQGRKFAAALKGLGEDGTFSAQQLAVGAAVAEQTDIKTAVDTMKTMRKDPKPRNLVKVKEPNPSDPNKYRERLIDQDNPAGGYVDNQPAGWQFEHNPKVAGGDGEVSSKKVTALSTAMKTEISAVMANRHIDLTQEEQASIGDMSDPKAILSMLNNKPGVSKDVKDGLTSDIKEITDKYIPKIRQAVGVEAPKAKTGNPKAAQIDTEYKAALSKVVNSNLTPQEQQAKIAQIHQRRNELLGGQ
jgi:hypothetical protein